MVKRLIQGLLLGSLAVHFNAYALGLGEIQLDSALNQPLSAEIELLSATPEDADSVNVSLASYETFSKVGIDRPSILSLLRFNVAAKGEGYVIKVDSHDSIREPFLDFILEVTWSSGRVLREYTLLLDPPSLKKAKPAQIQAPAVKPATKAQTKQQAPARAASVQKRPAAKSPKLAGTIIPTDEGGISYGPVRNGETLWAIAKEMRSGSSLSTQQMLMALLEENPKAFIAGDINRLKRGSILRLNNPDIVGSLSRQQAAAEVAQRTQPTAKGKTGAEDEQQIGTDSATAKRPSLKLVTPDTKSLSEKMGASAEGGDSGALRQELMLALEISEAQRRENEALKERMGDLQKQLDALKRLVTLKDGDLAQIQQQLSESNEMEESAPAPVVEALVEPAVVAETPVEETAAVVAETPALVIPDVPEAEEETITDALKQDEAPVVTEQKPEVVEAKVAPAPKPQVVPVPAPVVKPVAQPDFISSLIADPMFLTAGGSALALILLLILLIIKKRGNRFHESILSGDASSMGATTSGGPDTSFLSDLAISGLAGGSMEADEGEVDPITEADVYMAYGRTQQAESLLKDALESTPDRLELKSKLLEVYFTAKDKEQFDATIADCAEQLQEDEAAWKKILIMGHELSPENALFAEAPEAEAVEEEELDFAEGEDTVFDDVLDIGIDLDELSAEMESTTGDELDFDLGLDFSDLDDDMFSSSSDKATDKEGAEESSEENGESFDLGELDIDTDSESENTLELDTLAETEESSAEDANETDDGALDFDIEGLDLDDLSIEDDESVGAEPATTKSVEADVESESDDTGGLDFSLDDLDDLDSSDTPDLSAELDDALSSIDDELEDIGDLGDLGDLSMDADKLGLSEDEADESIGEPESNDALDIETELELDIAGLDDEAAAPEISEEPVDADESDDLGDFDFDALVTGDEPAADSTPDTDSASKDDVLDGLDDLGDFDLDILDDDSSDEGGLDDFDLDAELDSSESDMDTKIDLAKAYVEMGDTDGARNMLNEVITQGDDDQKKQAQDLLDSI